MKTLLVAVSILALLFPLAFAQGKPDKWIGIDCGSNRSTAANGLIWQTDDSFIKTGTNHLIPEDKNKALAYLNTVRAFTEQNKNCYTLPADTGDRYLIRAGFFYANYDGLNHPPAFDLQIDGNKMETVASSLDGVEYYEIIYWSRRDNISVCLARTQDGDFPFISSLEAWSIPDTMYESMNQELAWINTYRYNYGTDDWITGYPVDTYNRVWEPIHIPSAHNISVSWTLYDYTEESPPESAIQDAIQSLNETFSILLSFSQVKTLRPIYIEAYFTEPQSFSADRIFDIYVDGARKDTITPSYGDITAEKLLGQTVSSNLTIELRPTQNSTLPPVISAIEIYSSSDPLITNGTNQDDVNGLVAIISAFDQLKGWSGEPCLPADTVWQWLACSTDSDSPRVTALYLSGYGLIGILPSFSQMQALEDIDLSNNRLSGQIPWFLGQLPNLKKLNLSHNDFSGTLPASIRKKRGLLLDSTGNPNLKGKSSNATTIGLAVGIPLAIIILIVAGLVFWRIRKPANQEPIEAPAGHETGNGAIQDSFTISASTEQLIGLPPGRPTAPPMEATPEEDDIDENCLPIKPPAQQSMVPEMDLDELEQLIDERPVESSPEEDNEDENFLPVSMFAMQPEDQSMVPEMDLDELEQLISDNNRFAVVSDDEEDFVEVREYGAMASSSDLDKVLKDLDDISRHEKEKAEVIGGGRKEL